MTWLYRFDTDGRYLGKVLQDRPTEAYVGRTDLTALCPPDAPTGYSAYLVEGSWLLRQDPSPSAESPPPRLWRPWAQGGWP